METMRKVLSRHHHRQPAPPQHHREPPPPPVKDEATAAHPGAADVESPHQCPVHHREYAREHPGECRRKASLAYLTIAGGVIAFVCGALSPTHFAAVCVGIMTIAFGLYSQLVSDTTVERWINVIGLGLAFLGLGLGLRHGGFHI
ncbi:hypothetical protein GCM10023191_080520 [Actinoallomurus oryzae]|uniref:Uncharacterized protein n=2 Tax=Actinoallomurus oryzae TaxID=502180 RepID=A0ABP8QYM8_9ACTN